MTSKNPLDIFNDLAFALARGVLPLTNGIQESDLANAFSRAFLSNGSIDTAWVNIFKQEVHCRSWSLYTLSDDSSKNKFFTRKHHFKLIHRKTREVALCFTITPTGVMELKKPE